MWFSFVGGQKQHLKVIIVPKRCLNEGIRAVLTELREVLVCYPKILNVGDKLPNKRLLKPGSPCLRIWFVSVKKVFYTDGVKMMFCISSVPPCFICCKAPPETTNIWYTVSESLIRAKWIAFSLKCSRKPNKQS